MPRHRSNQLVDLCPQSCDVQLKLSPGIWGQHFIPQLPIFLIYFNIYLANSGINPVVQFGHCGKVGDKPGMVLFIQPWSGSLDNSQHTGRENLLMEHF